MENLSDQKVWENIHKARTWGQYPSEHVVRFVARNYYGTDRRNIKILDFGCGAGAHTWYLAREGFEAYAFDYSPSAVARVNEMLAQEGLQAEVSVKDALNLDYSPSFFDAVIDSLCVSTNPISSICMMYGKIYDILKQGGKLLSIVFGRNMDGYGTGEKIEEGTFRDVTEGVIARPGVIHFFDRYEINTLLTEAGFADIGIDYVRYTDKGHFIEQYIVQAVKR